MDSGPSRDWRAAALLAALFAVTLNFLQPLAHAALLQNSNLSAAWTAFCASAVADPDDSGRGRSTQPVPAPGAGKHDCCLGLAHAPTLIEPSSDFTVLMRIEAVPLVLLPATRSVLTSIRAGPSKPRAPPFLA
ncbi:DUF2946 family protein [Reyranella sp.]|uniref:DUF2946 family protein n=1 Tax=Reyranella sp. TaxID=1929291 RepID=UPI003D10E1D8